MSNRYPHENPSNRRSPDARPRPSGRLRGGAVALALAGVCAAALPGSGLAAQAKPVTVSYNVTVKPLVLARGTTVKAKATVASPEASVKSWWSQKTVAAVVRKGVNGGRQTPYSSEGFRCTPIVRGETTSFTCKLTGADVPTTVRLTFAVIFRGAQASG
jgi:hypothetical protein